MLKLDRNNKVFCVLQKLRFLFFPLFSLFFNDIILQEENLEIPHPRITERAFVLIPLMDINPNLNIKNKSIKEHLKALTKEERDEVKEFIGDE